MLAFEDNNCLIYPDRIDEHTRELRWIAVGAAQTKYGAPILLVTVHVYREAEYGEEIIRIISAREAQKDDIRRYQAQAMDQE